MDSYRRNFTSEQLSALESAVKQILEIVDPNPSRGGLCETPHRVAKMYEEIFQGSFFTNDEIAKLLDKCFIEPDAKDLVVMSNIPAFSYCEHHMALMYNMKISVAYLPNGKVIGLSKIARIVDLVTKRLQLQERIGDDIAYIMEKICNTSDCMVVITGEHSCMTARGISKPGVATSTAVLHGMFRENDALRKEVYDLIERGK